jgi:hypothetical protein
LRIGAVSVRREVCRVVLFMEFEINCIECT